MLRNACGWTIEWHAWIIHEGEFRSDFTVHLPFRSSISLYFGKDPITVLNHSSHWQAKTVALWYRQYSEKDNGNCCYCTTISWRMHNATQSLGVRLLPPNSCSNLQRFIQVAGSQQQIRDSFVRPYLDWTHAPYAHQARTPPPIRTIPPIVSSPPYPC